MAVYFNLNDKKNLSNLDEKPKIISPLFFEAKFGYGLDPVIKELYTELYNRNFDILGLDIEFRARLKSKFFDDNVIEIDTIKNEHFEMSFHGYDSGNFKYKEREINFYSDRSSTNLYTYVGTDWEEDKEAFFYSSKIHAKMDNKKRIYLKYKCKKNGEEFIHDDDGDRDYSPEGKEPKSIKFNTEINKLKNFLLDLVYELQQLPEGTFDETIFDYEKTLLKEPLKLTTFYTTYGDKEELTSIISPSNRLISYSGATPEDGEFRDIYNEGFIYCEISEGQEEPINTKDFSVGGNDSKFIIEIELKYSDCVYVLDLEPREHFLNSRNTVSKFNIFGEKGEAEEKKELSELEWKKAYNKILVSKMTKLEDYDGSYIKPIYITNRFIRKDEIKTVTKCKVKDYRRGLTSAELLDF